MNNFLQNRAQIDQATKYLHDNGFVQSGISCKNWEVAQILPLLKDGNLLDMGASGSVVLENAVLRGIKGEKMGIDLIYPQDIKSEILGIDLVSGDMMATPFPSGFFSCIVSLSTIEHQISFDKLAKECSRLLCKGGMLYLSFDFWEPKPDTSKTRLYDLDWNILDTSDVIELENQLLMNGLSITSPIDWTLKDAVINDRYCSPAKGVEYSFGILEFIKA